MVVRAGALVLLFLLAVLPHLLSRLIWKRSRWPRRFLAASAWICGARVRRSGLPPSPHSLLVANHVSWLDILIIGGATGCAFVSKDELGHPIVHWLADQNGTLYVRRDHRKGSKDQAMEIARALEGEQPVAIFPEGTTGSGKQLLPFRSALLEAAGYAARDVEVRPVAIDYGDAAREIAWFGERGIDNVKKVLGRKGTMAVTVDLLAPLDRDLDRKALARAAEQAVADRLASTPPRHPL